MTHQPTLQDLLKYEPRLIPTHKGTYDPESQMLICNCWRKQSCPAPGKHPLYKDFLQTPIPNYQSPTLISELENAKCNFAIATGPLPNNPEQSLIIYDIDLPAIQQDDPFIHTLPSTLTIRTPSSGLHFYYLIPTTQATPSKIRNLSTGYIDIRAKGGYALCPPSQGYEFTPSSLSKITLLDTPLVPPTRSSHTPNSNLQHTFNFTQKGTIPIGERDAFIFHSLLTGVRAGRTLNELYDLCNTLYPLLEQRPNNVYLFSTITQKATYIFEKYADPEIIALKSFFIGDNGWFLNSKKQ